MLQHQLHVLHIEDDQVDRMVIGRILKKQGIPMSLSHAANGIEALEVLQKMISEGSSLPDIILLDINMSKMNGIEFLSELRSNPTLSTISVFIVTTSADESDRKAAFRHHVAGYFLKPVEPEQLEKTFSVLTDYWSLNQWPES